VRACRGRVHGVAYRSTRLSRQSWYVTGASCDSARVSTRACGFVSTTAGFVCARRSLGGPFRNTKRATRVVASLRGVPQTGHDACHTKDVVLKKVQDLAAALAVLAVLFGTLMVINPRVREQFSEMTTNVQGRESLGPVQNAAYAVMSIGADYASDNPFLFTFLVAAVVLFMLMVRS